MSMKTEEIINKLIRAAVDSVQPENFIPKVIQSEGGRLLIGGEPFDPRQYARVFIAAVGKAAVGMTKAADRLLHPYISEGVVLTKHIPERSGLDKRYKIIRGGHPVPTEGSIAGAKAILEMLDRAGENDLVLFMISGGGSALMTAPQGGISLETFQEFSSAILGCGADITEFNTLRKHLDAVKGGRLALRAAPARQISIILSDVVGSPLDVIASGPTVPDPSSYKDALRILDRYSDKTKFPGIIRETLRRGEQGELPETLKKDDPAFSLSRIILAAENRTAARAAEEKGRELGFRSAILTTRLTGEASAVGAILPAFLSEPEAPELMIFGGETTVNLNGSGLGGRNLETALAAVRPMASYPGCALVTLATDGEDGPTDAAGAIVTSETLSRALELGCDPAEYLKNNDSYHFFEKTGGLLKPGSTGTNVNDLTFLIRNP